MDNNEAIGSNPTKHAKAYRLAPTEVQNNDWLLEYEDSYQANKLAHLEKALREYRIAVLGEPELR